MRFGGLWVIGVAGLAACGEPRAIQAERSGTAGECGSCHTAPAEAPPFRSVRGVPGAHDLHLDGQLAGPFACAECHTVPQDPDEPGHYEDAPGDVAFGSLARTGGATPAWNGAGCSASYCHGAFPGGNAANAPVFDAPRAASCGTCHGLPPGTGQHFAHAGQGLSCLACHGGVVPETHVNGVKDVPLSVWNASVRSCGQACHGPRSWDGP